LERRRFVSGNSDHVSDYSASSQLKLKLDEEYQKFKENSKSLLGKIKGGTSIVEVIRDDYPPLLRDVALVLLSLPPTQVSVERIFSMLKLLKSDLRTRLKEDILSTIIFLRANKIALKK
jgi:hypothetical protein